MSLLRVAGISVQESSHTALQDISVELLQRLAQLPEYPWIRSVLGRTGPAVA